ncbi:MAG: hypothetical protein WD046_09500 [Paracoccaceae bacterium]
MKLLLHIGTQKTGSTAIQAMLYRSRGILAHHGFHVMTSSGTGNYRKLATACLDLDRVEKHLIHHDIPPEQSREAFRQKTFDEFSAEIEGLEPHIHTVVMSGEHFSSNTTRCSELALLRSQFTLYFSDVQVLCYLRDQVSLQAAHYSTSLKSGNPEGFGDAVTICNPNLPFFNYALMLEKWAIVFGKKALDVRLFSREHWRDGDLLSDMVATLDVALVDKIRREDNLRNPSLNHHGQLLLRAINEVVPATHGQPNHVRYHLVDLCETLFAGPGQYPPQADQAKIYEAFRSSNAAVARAYFDTEEDLFAPPDYPEGLMPMEPDFISAIAKVLSALVQPDVMILPGHYADLFRNAATKLQSEDAETAYQLMHLAGVMRPSGVEIQRNLKEIEAMLHGEAPKSRS